jgi:hypothetical protein
MNMSMINDRKVAAQRVTDLLMNDEEFMQYAERAARRRLNSVGLNGDATPEDFENDENLESMFYAFQNEEQLSAVALAMSTWFNPQD